MAILKAARCRYKLHSKVGVRNLRRPVNESRSDSPRHLRHKATYGLESRTFTIYASCISLPHSSMSSTVKPSPAAFLLRDNNSCI
ncbi:hypothetical protein A9K55_006720 [Cordyceps militaris]|uniref:Uncharacterized protein n=1 Tax=Cordyceps militaris TaxID=73501 RepID=A0A2H4SAF5_CORMI|nr:hypothetical protein A9K55_006720 [Cordyceps militaris]